jgi:ribosomal protein L13
MRAFNSRHSLRMIYGAQCTIAVTTTSILEFSGKKEKKKKTTTTTTTMTKKKKKERRMTSFKRPGENDEEKTKT